MTEILLVRHAATTWSGVRYCGRTDVPLSPEGRRQARRVAGAIARSTGRGAHVVTSPQRRALQTAAAIVAAVGRVRPGVDARPDVDARWAEADMGAAEGRTFEELAAGWPDLAARLLAGEPDVAWPDGDVAGALSARVGTAIAELADDPGPTIVVSHGGPIRVAVALATGGSASLGILPPGGIVRLVRTGGRGDPWRLEPPPA